ncbi:ribokinase [Dactylosporangium sp. CS-033363]|uniref:ribokinase n=1 Tax=Dactylosporangium sp. CS-033363 TaxID=3239935 RepID=UPI003D91BFB9
MNKVIVVGSVNVDVISRVGRLPRPGETILGRDSESALLPGGKGANQAVAAARLGVLTLLFGAVGADAFGNQLRDTLGAEGVGLAHLSTVDGATTGVAQIVVAADGENTIVVSSGANFRFAPAGLADLPAAVEPGDVVLLQLEIPVATCLAAAGIARAGGARVVLNAAPSPEGEDPDLADLLDRVDVLVVNETEALAMAADAVPHRPEDPAAWFAVAAALRKQGPDACVITLGADGAVASDDTGDWHQPAFPVDVVDTTGAGDAFCGGLAARLAAGGGLNDAVCTGAAAGALATGRLGAQAALPDRAAVEALAGGWS